MILGVRGPDDIRADHRRGTRSRAGRPIVAGDGDTSGAVERHSGDVALAVACLGPARSRPHLCAARPFRAPGAGLAALWVRRSAGQETQGERHNERTKSPGRPFLRLIRHEIRLLVLNLLPEAAGVSPRCGTAGRLMSPCVEGSRDDRIRQSGLSTGTFGSRCTGFRVRLCGSVGALTCKQLPEEIGATLHMGRPLSQI